MPQGTQGSFPAPDGAADYAWELAPPQASRTTTLWAWALEVGGRATLLLDVETSGLRVSRIGPGFENVTGYTVGDFLGHEYDFLRGPGTDEHVLADLHCTLRAGVPGCWVLRSYRKDGTAFWSEVVIGPVFDEGGALASVRVLQCDVTERTEARARLEHMSALLADRQQFTSAVLEGIHAAIITADARGRVTFINRVAWKTLGVTPAQCSDVGLIPLLNLPPNVFEGLTEADRVKRMSYTFRRDDGQSIEIGLSMSRAFGDAHHDLGYFVVFRDLSDTMQFELDVRRVERLAALGTMVAGFAHEVRNPVTTLRLLIEVMRAEAPAEDPTHEYLSRMMQQVERIERLVKTSLQFGRPVAPRRSYRSASAIVAAALDAIAVSLEGMAKGSIWVEVEPGLPDIFADDSQVTQILVILLENALDAAERPGGVALRAGAAGADSVQFEVRDDGPGIRQSLMNRIFDSFFTTKPDRTGLGLSIAQQLAHENGGSIEVSSAEGVGTTFTLVVPARPLSEVAPGGAPEIERR